MLMLTIIFSTASLELWSDITRYKFSNKSINDSYEILFSLKRLINIMSGAFANKDTYSLDELVKILFAKIFIFKKRSPFREILIKINSNKISKN